MVRRKPAGPVHVGRFTNSRELVWFTLKAAIALQVLAVIVARAEAMIVLAASIPTMLGLVAAWTHSTNAAETKLPVLPKE